MKVPTFKAAPDPTFDRTTKGRFPRRTDQLVSRKKEINTQKYAAGNKTTGTTSGPVLDY